MDLKNAALSSVARGRVRTRIIRLVAAFIDKLRCAARANDSLLCIGLDPDPERLPEGVSISGFNRAIIEATSDLVCAYKPNIAFYEQFGIDGLRALEATVAAVPAGIPVIVDAKRGDIGNTARAYAKALFETWGFDAATVNPYLGGDSLEPFLDYGEKGVFVLCRTSNPGSSDVQALLTMTSPGGAPMPLYQRVALMAIEWNGRGNAGLLVGATQADELRWVREHCPSMPLLIPGVGAQGGDLAAAVRAGVDANGELAIINSSREVLYAFREDGAGGFAEAARRAAVRVRDRMREALPARL